MKWLRIGDHSYEAIEISLFFILNFFTLEDRKIRRGFY